MSNIFLFPGKGPIKELYRELGKAAQAVQRCAEIAEQAPMATEDRVLLLSELVAASAALKHAVHALASQSLPPAGPTDVQ